MPRRGVPIVEPAHRRGGLHHTTLNPCWPAPARQRRHLSRAKSRHLPGETVSWQAAPHQHYQRLCRGGLRRRPDRRCAARRT